MTEPNSRPRKFEELVGKGFGPSRCSACGKPDPTHRVLAAAQKKNIVSDGTNRKARDKQVASRQAVYCEEHAVEIYMELEGIINGAQSP